MPRTGVVRDLERGSDFSNDQELRTNNTYVASNAFNQCVQSHELIWRRVGQSGHGYNFQCTTSQIYYCQNLFL